MKIVLLVVYLYASVYGYLIISFTLMILLVL